MKVFILATLLILPLVRSQISQEAENPELSDPNRQEAQILQDLITQRVLKIIEDCQKYCKEFEFTGSDERIIYQHICWSNCFSNQCMNQIYSEYVIDFKQKQFDVPKEGSVWITEGFNRLLQQQKCIWDWISLNEYGVLYQELEWKLMPPSFREMQRQQGKEGQSIFQATAEFEGNAKSNRLKDCIKECDGYSENIIEAQFCRAKCADFICYDQVYKPYESSSESKKIQNFPEDQTQKVIFGAQLYRQFYQCWNISLEKDDIEREYDTILFQSTCDCQQSSFSSLQVVLCEQKCLSQICYNKVVANYVLNNEEQTVQLPDTPGVIHDLKQSFVACFKNPEQLGLDKIPEDLKKVHKEDL